MAAPGAHANTSSALHHALQILDLIAVVLCAGTWLRLGTLRVQLRVHSNCSVVRSDEEREREREGAGESQVNRR